MLTDSEKLKLFRKKQKLTQEQLAAALDVSKSLIISIENNQRKLSMNVCAAIKQKYGIDLCDDTRIIQDSNIIPIPVHNIQAAAGEGAWIDDQPIQDVMYFDKRFLTKILNQDNYNTIHIIFAKGDSMDSGWSQPDDIKDGDLLMVDTSQTTGNNQIFVIMVNNQELRVKRLAKRGDTLYITSNNSNYKEEIYKPDTSDVEIKVIGKVVWNGSRDSL